MKVVDLSLFEEGDDLVQLRVRKMLELLGVKNLYPSEIINFHILPQFKQEHWMVNINSLLLQRVIASLFKYLYSLTLTLIVIIMIVGSL